jgi:hypothetical protein
MRLLFSLLLGLALVFPLSAQQSAATSNQSYTLISVSHPGCAVAEAEGLCIVSLPGTTVPLHLKIVPGLADPKGVSLESVANPGYFLRHQNSRLKLHPFPENDGLFAADSTFYLMKNSDGSVSFRSYNYSKEYITVTAAKELYITPDPEQPVRSFTLNN